jgi:thiamine-phosphate diphosphorylase
VTGVPDRHHRLLPFRIYAITDRQALPVGMTLPEAVARLLAAAPAGRVAIQLRDKDLAASDRWDLARRLREITRRHGALLIINGDLQLARACEADGVHFPDGHPGLDSLTDTERGQGADRLWIGASCHDWQGMQRAEESGADFVTMSPVMPSPGKATPGQELGWNRFTDLAQRCALPTFALGGLGSDEAALARDCGAYGIAAIRSLWQASQPRELLAAMLEPFAPIGSGARGGRIGRALPSSLAMLLCVALSACGPSTVPGGDDDSETDDDDSAEPVALIPVDIPLPNDPFALECQGSEPDDVDIPLGSINVIDPPWPQASDCGSIPATAQGLLLHVHGSLQDLVEGTWDGDNDSFRFTVEREVTTRGVLRWDPLQGDFDALVRCERGDSWGDLFGRRLATTAVAETAEAAFAIEAGSSCWVVVIGFSGLVGSYDFWLEEIAPL